MISHVLILFSLCFITSTAYPMEIIKKETIKKKPTTKCQHPIITDFLVIQRILNTFPKDIITHTQRFCIQLRNKDFQNSFPSLNSWDAYTIPRHYHYYLTQQQTLCLNQYFIRDRLPYSDSHDDDISFSDYHNRRTSKNYYLSLEPYTVFMTIPVEIRQYLKKSPQSIKKKKEYTSS